MLKSKSIADCDSGSAIATCGTTPRSEYLGLTMFKPASDWHPESVSVTAARMMQTAVSSVAKIRFRFMANRNVCKGLARPAPRANRCGMVCRLQANRQP